MIGPPVVNFPRGRVLAAVDGSRSSRIDREMKLESAVATYRLSPYVVSGAVISASATYWVWGVLVRGASRRAVMSTRPLTACSRSLSGICGSTVRTGIPSNWPPASSSHRNRMRVTDSLFVSSYTFRRLGSAATDGDRVSSISRYGGRSVRSMPIDTWESIVSEPRWYGGRSVSRGAMDGDRFCGVDMASAGSGRRLVRWTGSGASYGFAGRNPGILDTCE